MKIRKHLKRMAIPKEWPISRKGTKYVTRPYTGKGGYAIPLLLVLRDILKVAHTKREAKLVLYEKNVLVDNKIVGNCSYPVGLFDLISMPKLNMFYRVELSDEGRLILEKITKDSHLKTCKVVGKTVLSGKRLQINLHDGKNFISSQKINVNDSVVVDINKKEIVKIMPLKKKPKFWL